MSTLVTGAFGCIGAWVTRGLLSRGETPILHDYGADPWRLRMIVGPDRLAGLTMLRGDIGDRDQVVGLVDAHDIDRIIHLAAWQMPLCRQDPSGGARVNVVGTANVFEAARAARGRVKRIVYFSSAAVFGPVHLYPPGPLGDDAARLPATHYGVYKVANEDQGRVYWDEHRIPSVGFRPLSVYGLGRDFGISADPTIAMKAAVLGRPFRIRWGGATDLIHAEDVAQAAIAAAYATLDGARVYNLHGESVAIGDAVRMIEEAVPSARGQITHAAEPLPVPSALADAGYQRDLGPRTRTGFKEGLRRTIDEFLRLKGEGRLDSRELTPPDSAAPSAPATR